MSVQQPLLGGWVGVAAVDGDPARCAADRHGERAVSADKIIVSGQLKPKGAATMRSSAFLASDALTDATHLCAARANAQFCVRRDIRGGCTTAGQAIRAVRRSSEQWTTLC